MKTKKPIPKWFLWTVLGLLLYASISNYIVFSSNNWSLITKLTWIAIAITIIWFLLNIVLAIYFKKKNYQTKAWAFSTYYAVLNGLNLIKIFLHIPLNNAFLFYFQIATKIFELCIVVPALLKYYKK